MFSIEVPVVRHILENFLIGLIRVLVDSQGKVRTKQLVFPVFRFVLPPDVLVLNKPCNLELLPVDVNDRN